MKAEIKFGETLTSALRGWASRESDDCVLSIALPVGETDPLTALPLLGDKEEFRFLWDEAPKRCIAALGRCQNFSLNGPRRFELAQRFSDAVFARLINTDLGVSKVHSPRILFAFTFFEQNLAISSNRVSYDSVEAVLPTWQLSQERKDSYLRLNAVVNSESDVRDMVEKIWLMKEKLCVQSKVKCSLPIYIDSGQSLPNQWKECYRPALIRGIELVEQDCLDKLVLAVRQSIWVKQKLEPLSILGRLRGQQKDSCRFLWQPNFSEAFFGASPERLLSLLNGHLEIDALAGTSTVDDQGHSLLNSEKDLLEHELVASSITQQLIDHGLKPKRIKKPKISRYGQLLHLHTPILASANGKLPLHLISALHPTPAVAGLPRNEAMNWLRVLEPFERGRYAAPIGWIDLYGNAEFRVAIRSGNINKNHVELTAGAGLVKGSVPDKEIQEVGLKLAVLADQFDLQSKLSSSCFIV